jgi:hypothetical protein
VTLALALELAAAVLATVGIFESPRNLAAWAALLLAAALILPRWA